MRTLPMKVSKTGEDRRAEGGVVLKKSYAGVAFFTQLDSLHRLPLEKEENYNKILLPF